MSAFSGNMRAIALFVFVMLGNACTIVIVRHLSHSDYLNYSVFQIVFVANLIGALLSMPLWAWRYRRCEKRSSHFSLYMGRALLEFISFSASFYAITQIPLPMHTALLFMTPVFGTIIALLVLREHGTRVTYGCIAVGFIGMLIITRPGQSGVEWEIGIVFALLAALGFASCGTLIKLLTRHQPPSRIARYMLWMTSTIAAPFAMAHWQTPPAAHWVWFAALGALAFCLQHAIAKALSQLPYITVIPLNFAQLVFVSALAWLFFDQTVSIYTIGGSALILAATLYNAWYSARHAREMAAREDAQSNPEQQRAA